MGSGGINGRGFLGGTQRQLNLLPEKQTDFNFTMFAEKTGFAGAVALIVLYASVFYGLLVLAMRARGPFARLVASATAATFALHVDVHIGMVTGLLPVVGVPLRRQEFGTLW